MTGLHQVVFIDHRSQAQPHLCLFCSPPGSSDLLLLQLPLLGQMRLFTSPLVRQLTLNAPDRQKSWK